MERRLAAILAADVVGYSRLMGVDEAGTLAALRALLKEVVEPTLKRHRGRVVKLMGDGLLAEFASVVDAVAAAVEIQEATPERSAHLPEDRRIALRVGVNIGDIAVEGGDIFGDGVNIAARLQEVADPNGMAVSDDAYRQLSGRLNVPFQDAGEKALKNIKQKVRTWLWSPTQTLSNAPVSDTQLALPDKPSIAVLPFDNLTGDPEQEYFADGMTEDIITGLSRFRSLFVIARNSTFSYKGKSPDVRAVARDLGVRYVLEGSVRRGGDRIRITGQLIEAETGNHLWAERYDRKLEDIFDVQDEVTASIVVAIAPEIDEAERTLAQRKPPGSLDIWSRFQIGLAASYISTKEALKSAIEQFDEINTLDPTFAPAFAYGVLARFRILVHYDWNNKELVDQAREKARRAIALDPKNPDCLMAESRVYTHLHQYEVAISKAEEAISLNPNSAMAHFFLGLVLGRTGRYEEAIAQLDRSIRLSPRDAFAGGFFGFKAVMLFHVGRYEEAVDWARRANSSTSPRPGVYLYFTASLIKLDRKEEAVAGLAEFMRLSPNITLSEWRERTSLQFPRAGKATEVLIEALREAGMPE